MMKKYFGALLFIGLFSACNNNDEPQPVPEKENITILSYLVANNNLNDYLVGNIATMYDGLLSMNKPATFLVYWDGKTQIGTNNASHLILKYQTDGKGNINGRPVHDLPGTMEEVLNEGVIVKEYAPQLSTDKDVMTAVLKDMMANANSDKFGLIFGSHGSSWLSSIFTSRSFGQDGQGTDNTMLISDMAEALKSVGKKFEFILFDVCYMGTAEVAYTFRDVANYQISSAMEVPAYGFPYDLTLEDLYEGTVSNYKKVCETYLEYYKLLYEIDNYAWGTISLIDSKEMVNLTNQLKSEIVAHKEMLADYDSSHLEEYGKSSGPYIAVDLGHFVKDLNDGSMPATFSSQLAKTILYKGCLEQARPYNYAVDAANYSGLGIYIPVEERPKWNTYFKTIEWYNAAGWNEVTFSWDF